MASTTVAKKSGVKKAKASHPSYFEMIKEAVLALKEKTGSSPHAIAKYMEEKHKSVLPPNFRKVLAVQLKNSVAKGNLIKIKASFKLSEAGKKVAASKKVVAKPKVVKKKPVEKEKKKKKAVAVVKAKVASKKRAAPVVKAKVPKSIKSPAAKRARKAV